MSNHGNERYGFTIYERHGFTSRFTTGYKRATSRWCYTNTNGQGGFKTLVEFLLILRELLSSLEVYLDCRHELV